MAEANAGTPSADLRAAMPTTARWQAASGLSLRADAGHLAVLVEAGEASCNLPRDTGSEWIAASTPSILFVPAGSSMAVRTSGAGASATSMSIPPGFVADACPHQKMEWRPAAGESWPRIAEAMRWLQRASYDGASTNHPLVQRSLVRLLAHAFGGMSRRPDDSWLPAPALGRITTLTRESELDGISIASLASDAGLGTSAFSRAFRGSTGWTPGEFLTEVRLGRVASMLATTDLPLTEITRRVGLASVAHVSQQFGSRHGMGVRRFRAAAAERDAQAASVDPRHHDDAKS